MNGSLDNFINSLPLKVKTRLEVAEEFGISVRTLLRRLKKSEITLQSGNIFPNKLREIYSSLGVPAKVNGSNPAGSEV